MMEVRRVYSFREDDVSARDFSFDITSEIAEPYDASLSGPEINTRPVPKWTKSYGLDPEDFADLDSTDQAFFVLSRGEEIFGYALAEKAWNGMVTLEDIALDATVRGKGHGKSLLRAVLKWARGLKAAGVRTETQSNNVAACRLYKRFDFLFGGYDRYLYRGIPENKDEVAIFWYYLFDTPGESG